MVLYISIISITLDFNYSKILFMEKCYKSLLLTLIFFGLFTFDNNILAQSPPPVFSTTGTFHRVMPEDFLGLNGTNVLSPTEDWNAIEVNSALAGSSMRTFRFPGGTVSNYWDWRRGFDKLLDQFVLVKP